MEHVDCIICGGSRLKPLFRKESGSGEAFSLVRCPRCGLQFISPRPGTREIARYYGEPYFMKRTDRGYDDYFSEKTRREIERVTALNLADLGFYEFENSLPSGNRRVLDIGCAAGYFLAYCAGRGWDATGVDISEHCVEFARGAGLRVYEDDYLEIAFSKPFDLITMWASLEHLHHPDRFLAKARDELAGGGRLYLSTCRAGGANFMRLYGRRWRFYNFPEHLYFFSRRTIQELLERSGFRVVRYATYGSGFGGPGSRARKAADAMAKRLRLGDMMLVAAERV
jgi:SAM-dependent methyltransferase